MVGGDCEVYNGTYIMTPLPHQFAIGHLRATSRVRSNE
jgi:hypothetical protein